MFFNCFRLKALLFSAMLSVSGMAEAQTGETARLVRYDMSDGSVIRGMSDNGKWAVAYGSNAANEYSFPKIVDVASGVMTEVLAGSDFESGTPALINDITDDGKMAVGSYAGMPAYYNTETKTWTKLSLPLGFAAGKINAVTPDGHYAVGIYTQGGYDETPAMWDLTTKKEISTPGRPKVNLAGGYEGMCRYSNITADGRYIVGCVDFSYPQYVMYFIYDRETQTWDPIVFDYDVDKKTFTQKNERIISLDGVCISPDGKWAAGVLYTANDERCPFRYNMETKEVDYYTQPDDLDKGCVVVDNNGTVYAATPAVNPSRSLFIRSGNYWYGIDELLKQRYGIDYYTRTGYAATGLAAAVSGDGKTLACMAYISQDNYVVELPEAADKACEKVDLLADYTIKPVSGAAITKLSNITLKFTRKVSVISNTVLQLKDDMGNVVKTSLKFKANANDPKTVDIGFRTTTLEAGRKYTITIPAGSISLQGDDTKCNGEIVIEYTGYGNKVLASTGVQPASGTTIGHLDMTTNPVVFTFDTRVVVADNAKAYLYRNDDTEPVCELGMIAGTTTETANQIMVYPATSQNLYKGNVYHVVVPEGSVSDLSGGAFNEKLSVDYEGTYERTIVSDNTHIYIETFEGGVGNMMLYDGDGNTPTEAMQAWNFTSAIPWIHAADDDYTNMCAVSHSMYTPAGKSDDWMVTPQLVIPDDKCRLEFKGQGFSSVKSDRLKVIVYATDEVYNELDADIVSKFRSEGKVVLDEVLSPGESEGTLSGDWTQFSFSLAEYVGKKIYVAFVNENEDQSALFVADVNVVHDMEVQIALSGVPESGVGMTEQTIKGNITIKNPVETYSSLSIALKDGNGEVVDEISESGLALKLDDVYPFAFAKPLPLAKGKENKFTIMVKLNDGEATDSLVTSIKNLAFVPVKRLVLEEYTGQGCQNCPLGHLAVEKLEGLYGDRFIPLCYHVYTGDSFESGMTDYATYFLGMGAAPSGRLNRGAICSPMGSTTENGVTDYYFTSDDKSLWLDQANIELAKAAEADLAINAVYDEATGKLNIPYSVRYAIDKENVNVSMLFVVTEDNLSGYQQNNLYSMTDDDLGEWQKDGIYGKSLIFPYYFNDVARALYPANYGGMLGLVPGSVSSETDYTGNVTFGVAENAPYVTDINNCKVTCIMTDANTGEVINVARAKVTDSTGILNVEDESDVKVAVADNAVVLNAENADVTILSLDGVTLATANVKGCAVIPVSYNGIVIVKAVTDNATVTRKLMMK